MYFYKNLYTAENTYVCMYTNTHTWCTWLRDKWKLTWLIHRIVKRGLWVHCGVEENVFLLHFLHAPRPFPVCVFWLCVWGLSQEVTVKERMEWLLTSPLPIEDFFLYKPSHISHIIFQSRIFPGFPIPVKQSPNSLVQAPASFPHVLPCHLHPQPSPDPPPHSSL